MNISIRIRRNVSRAIVLFFVFFFRLLFGTWSFLLNVPPRPVTSGSKAYLFVPLMDWCDVNHEYIDRQHVYGIASARILHTPPLPVVTVDGEWRKKKKWKKIFKYDCYWYYHFWFGYETTTSAHTIRCFWSKWIMITSARNVLQISATSMTYTCKNANINESIVLAAKLHQSRMWKSAEREREREKNARRRPTTRQRESERVWVSMREEKCDNCYDLTCEFRIVFFSTSNNYALTSKFSRSRMLHDWNWRGGLNAHTE